MRPIPEDIQGLLISIKEVLSRYLNLKQYKVYCFGSWVSGKAKSGSDVDVGVLGESISNDVWAAIWLDVEEIPTLRKIDIVDLSKVSNEFKSIALKDAVEI